MRKYGEYGEEYIQRAEEIFLSSQMTIRELANQSATLLGREISEKHLARIGNSRNWYVRRAQEGNPNADISYELEVIRAIIFQQIQVTAESGLFITGYDNEGDILAALEPLGVDVRRINPEIDASLINAYMNMLSKANIQITPKGTAKTTLEQATEQAREALEKAGLPIAGVANE